MERDLLVRIKTVFGNSITDGGEIVVPYFPLVKGHPDFRFDGYPGDCKSVLQDDWLPKSGKVPFRIYSQMQAYMKYSETDKALLIFESRETGKMVDVWLRPDKRVHDEIDQKIRKIQQIMNESA